MSMDLVALAAAGRPRSTVAAVTARTLVGQEIAFSLLWHPKVNDALVVLVEADWIETEPAFTRKVEASVFEARLSSAADKVDGFKRRQ